jgi:hypothetical protein
LSRWSSGAGSGRRGEHSSSPTIHTASRSRLTIALGASRKASAAVAKPARMAIEPAHTVKIDGHNSGTNQSE